MIGLWICAFLMLAAVYVVLDSTIDDFPVKAIATVIATAIGALFIFIVGGLLGLLRFGWSSL